MLGQKLKRKTSNDSKQDVYHLRDVLIAQTAISQDKRN